MNLNFVFLLCSLFLGAFGTISQVHLQIFNENQVVVSFVIDNANTSALRVEYTETSGTGYTFSSADCISSYPGWNVGLRLCTALIPTTPARTFFYRIGDPPSEPFTVEYSFEVPSAFSISGFVLADQSSNTASAQLAGLAGALNNEDPRHVFLLAGDLAIANGDETLWDTYFDLMQLVGAEVPLMASPGFEDIQPNANGFINRIALHEFTANSGSNLYYSFNLGPVHFISISTSSPYHQNTAQYDWLVRDLQQANLLRHAQPWIVVFSHRSPYASLAENGARSNLLVRRTLDPLFHQYGVDFAFWGLNHWYERSCPVNEGTTSSSQVQVGDGTSGNPYINPQTIHITVGTGGQPLDSFAQVLPNFSCNRLANFGIVTFDASFSTFRITFEDAIQTLDSVFVQKVNDGCGRTNSNIQPCGRGQCSPEHGKCICEPGFSGVFCEHFADVTHEIRVANHTFRYSTDTFTSEDWTLRSFDDSSWSSGLSPLGRGDEFPNWPGPFPTDLSDQSSAQLRIRTTFDIDTETLFRVNEVEDQDTLLRNSEFEFFFSLATTQEASVWLNEQQIFRTDPVDAPSYFSSSIILFPDMVNQTGNQLAILITTNGLSAPLFFDMEWESVRTCNLETLDDPPDCAATVDRFNEGAILAVTLGIFLPVCCIGTFIGVFLCYVVNRPDSFSIRWKKLDTDLEMNNREPDENPSTTSEDDDKPNSNHEKSKSDEKPNSDDE